MQGREEVAVGGGGRGLVEAVSVGGGWLVFGGLLSGVGSMGSWGGGGDGGGVMAGGGVCW